jgi:hypothetical protein
VQLVSQLVQLSRVLRIVGDSLISYANIINSYEDVSLIPKEALWTPPTFNTSQDLAPILLGFPPVVQDTPLFYPLTNVNLLQIARIQHQTQESIAKKILTRPIKKAPLRKIKSSSSDIAMGSTSSSALKNELHPEDEEMNEIWDSFDASMEDLNQIDEAMAEPSTSTGLSSNEDVVFSLNTIIKKEESGPEEKDQRDEETQKSKAGTVFTHVDLKKFICPTSFGNTTIKPGKVNKQRSLDTKGSSSASGYYKPTNDSTDEQVSSQYYQSISRLLMAVFRSSYSNDFLDFKGSTSEMLGVAAVHDVDRENVLNVNAGREVIRENLEDT